jgi:hypothetical protein
MTDGRVTGRRSEEEAAAGDPVTATRRLTKRKEAAVSYGAAVPIRSTPSSPSGVSASGETDRGRDAKEKKGRRRFRHRSPRLVSSSSIHDSPLPTPTVQEAS